MPTTDEFGAMCPDTGEALSLRLLRPVLGHEGINRPFVVAWIAEIKAPWEFARCGAEARISMDPEGCWRLELRNTSHWGAWSGSRRVLLSVELPMEFS
jgi:hypothetical protein